MACPSGSRRQAPANAKVASTTFPGNCLLVDNSVCTGGIAIQRADCTRITTNLTGPACRAYFCAELVASASSRWRFRIFDFYPGSRRTASFTGGGPESRGKEGAGHPAGHNSPRARSRIVRWRFLARASQIAISNTRPCKTRLPDFPHAPDFPHR